jgi:hypothetical protein
MKKQVAVGLLIVMIIAGTRVSWARETNNADSACTQEDICEPPFDHWSVVLSPNISVASGTVVTFTATYYGGCCIAGGPVTISFNNQGQGCIGTEDGAVISTTLPASPYDGQVVVLGTLTFLNYCETSYQGTFDETSPGYTVVVMKPIMTVTP